MNNLNKKILSGVLWQSGDQLLSRIMQFVVAVTLARLISPKSYGIVALIQVFIGFCDPFVDGGFGTALVQKKEVDDLDCCSVFWLNLAMSTILCAVLWVFAPYIASFYKDMSMVWPIRGLEFVLVLTSLNIVNGALLQRLMQFNKNCIVNWSGQIAYGVVGITWAIISPSVWTLIGAVLAMYVVRIFVMFLAIRWFPKFRFNFHRIWGLFKYGSKLLGGRVLSLVNNSVVSLFIGRLFGPAEIAFYNRAQHYPALIAGSVNSMVATVFFPVYAKKQSENDALVWYCRKSIANCFFLELLPIAFLIVFATPVVRLMLTEKWLPCVPYLRLICPIYLLWCVDGSLQQCLNGKGNSGVVLGYRIFSVVSHLIIFFVASRWGILTMLWCNLIFEFFSMLGFYWFAHRFVPLTITMVFEDIWKSLTAALVAGGLAWCCGRFVTCNFVDNDFILLGAVSVVMTGGYLLFSWILKAEQVGVVKKCFEEIRRRRS